MTTEGESTGRPVSDREPAAGDGAGTAAPATLLSFGFRPFFLLAAVHASLGIAVWGAALALGVDLPAAFEPVAWHAHEMLFGFAAAGVAGFLLTAVPSWTGRSPRQGGVLALLAMLWLAGRVATTLGGGLPPLAVAVVDLAFLPAVIVLAAIDVVAAGNRRNYPVLAVVAGLVVANALDHAEAMGLAVGEPGAGQRLGLHVLVLLIALIGGRIVPNFTGNWLARTGREANPPAFGGVDKATLAVAAAAGLADVVQPGTAASGALLVAAGGLHAVRLGRWQGHRTLADPLVAVLHLGYLWLAVGSLLLGLAALSDMVPRIAGVHALGAGAIGTMLLAVMSRASLGHTGRALAAGPATVAAYALVTLAAAARIASAFWGAAWLELVGVSSAAWAAAFGVFFFAYLPAWLGPRVDGRPG